MSARSGRRWADLSLRSKGFVVLGIPVVAMIALGATALRVERTDARSERQLRRTVDARSTVEALYAALLAAESGARGFVMTGDEALLDSYRQPLARIPDLLARLGGLESPDARDRLARLRALADSQLALLRELVRTGRTASADARAAHVRRDAQSMQELRAHLEAVIAAEDRALAARMAERDQLQRRQWLVLVGGLVLGAFGGGVATYLFADGIVRRAEHLQRAAGALAAGEPLDAAMRGGDDEIGRVYAAMRRASVLLGERRRAQSALDALNKELEAFSYSVSHDLRAPLRSIDGFSQALLEDYHDRLDDTGRSYLARVRAAAQRMAELIDDILLLSRVTRAELRIAPVDLTAIARDVAERLAEQDPARRVEWRIAPDLSARADAQLLRVALDNLLGNAWKFTARKPDAVIEFVRGEPSGTFVVRDNGAGFDMAYAGKLFGAFQRLHAANDFAGTGIGLATVQRIVTKHGGRVWARGEVGQGAQFFFTLGEGQGGPA